MKRTFLIILLAGSALSLINPVSAYETPTHRAISEEAAIASILNARLKDIAPDLRIFSMERVLSDDGRDSEVRSSNTA